MHLRRPATLEAFVNATAPYLTRHEAEHGLLLHIAAAAARLTVPPVGAYWATVADDRGAILAAALRTAEKLLLSREGVAGAAALLGRDAFTHGTLAPGGGATAAGARAAAAPGPAAVLGPPTAVDAFAAAATAETGVGWRPGMAQRIHEVRRVVPPPRVPGASRSATSADAERLVAWVLAFTAETGGGTSAAGAETAAASVARRLADGALHVWDVGTGPVAMAAALGPTPRSMRVTGVYTPPPLRGRGYAGALVAALSQALLGAGREFVFLYTDAANPTSNALYARLGYAPVADVHELWAVPR